MSYEFKGALRSKLPSVGTTIFTVMSKLAVQYQAVNLSQGFPDFSCTSDLVNLVSKYMKKGLNQYAPMAGVIALREQIAAKMQQLYAAQYHPESEITITSGGTQAIFTAISAVVREGDEVIVFEPAYDCYVPAIELCGGKPVFVQLKFPEFNIDWDEVKKLIRHKTRMIIINTPNNPTGTLLSASDMMKLSKITRNTDIIILSDEVYEHIVFDGYEHQSVCRFPELAARSFVVFSFGKTYHTTGWKLGYCLAPANLMAEFRKCHQFIVFAANHPMQMAMADYLGRAEEYTGLSAFFQKKRDYFLELIKPSGLKPLACNGTYFQLLKYDHLSSLPDTEYAEYLLKEIGVASIPVSVFYHIPADHKILRFCFAKNDETLEKAAELLIRLQNG